MTLFFIILLIVVSLVCGVGVFLIKEGEYGEKETLWGRIKSGLFFGILAPLLVAIFFGLAGYAFGSIGGKMVEEQANSYPIYALEDNMSVNGQSFLFGGYIDENLVYCYRATYRNGYKTYLVDASDAYLRESSTEEPRIVHTVIYREPNWFGKIFLTVDEGKTFMENVYEIIIPPESMSISFNSDMKD